MRVRKQAPELGVLILLKEHTNLHFHMVPKDALFTYTAFASPFKYGHPLFVRDPTQVLSFPESSLPTVVSTCLPLYMRIGPTGNQILGEVKEHRRENNDRSSSLSLISDQL
jgi:hypothetical protein